MSGGEGRRLTGFSGHLGRGGALESADHIHGPAEVPPAGVVLRAMCHPGNRDGLPGGGGCTAGHLTPSPISGDHGTDLWEGFQRSAGQIGRYRPPRPNSDYRGELDGVLHNQSAPHCGAPQDRRI